MKTSTTPADRPQQAPFRVMDGAVLTALAIGYLYLLGFLNGFRSEGEVPSDAFPPPTANELLVDGGLIAIFASAAVLIPYLAFHVVMYKKLSAPSSNTRVKILLFFALASCAIAEFLPIPKEKDVIVAFPRITNLELSSSDKSWFDGAEWRLISHQNGYFFLGEADTKQIMRVRDETVLRITTESRKTTD